MRKRIIIAGLPRSGSTALFNIVRLMCEKCGKVYSGEINDGESPASLPKAAWIADYQVFKTHKYKRHESDLWIDKNTVVITSRRDIEDIKISMTKFRKAGNKGVGSEIDSIPKFLEWVSWWNTYVDGPLGYIDYWKLCSNPRGVIKDIASILQLPLPKNINDRTIYIELCKLQPPAIGKDPVTLLHAGHITSETIRGQQTKVIHEENQRLLQIKIEEENGKKENGDNIAQAESEEGDPDETYYD